MKPTEKDITKWCEALRSGKYSQTKGTLQDHKGYCCLGVACEIFIPKEKQRIEDDSLWGAFPAYQPNVPNWLSKISGAFYSKTEMRLWQMNDDYDFTFDEIADVLELVYIHKALD